MRRLLCAILMCTCSVCMFDTYGRSKVVKEARKTLRETRYNADAKEAQKITDRLNSTEKSLLDEAAKPEMKNRLPEYYYMAALIQEKFNKIENTKIFLNLSYDTVRYYNSICKMYDYMRVCDSLEDASGNYKYRKKIRKTLLKYRNNLLNGGKYYVTKSNYSDAYKFFDVYISSAYYPVFENKFLAQNDSNFTKVAYWAVTSAYYSGNYEGVTKYASEALQYGKNRDFIQEYVSKSYLNLGDTLNWLNSLKNGIINNPDYTYFFVNIMDYYNSQRDYEQSLAFADKMIRYNPKEPLFWFAQAMVYLKQRDYDKCIGSCDNVLALDKEHLEATYFMGISYMGKASLSSDSMKLFGVQSAEYRNYRKQMINNYRKALPYMEKFRKMSPDDTTRWAMPLYKIYLNLNKGKEFGEMDAILSAIKSK